MKRHLAALLFAACAPPCAAEPAAEPVAAPAAAPATVRLSIDATRVKGPMTPIRAWFGYDEPNYTTAPNGQRLLGEIAALSPVPVHVRTHNLMTPAQVAELQRASELAELGPATTVTPRDGTATVRMQLPRQAVSLVTLTY